MDFPKLDSFWWDQVTGIREVEHAPESGIGVGLRDLEEGEIWGVRRGKGELVDGRHDSCICNGPFEIAGGLATDSTGTGSTAVTGVRCSVLATSLRCTGWGK